MKKNLYIVFINIAVICTLLVLIEVIGQLLFFYAKGHWVYEKHSVHKDIFEVHPYLVGRLKSNINVSNNGKTIKSNKQHNRWTGAPEDAGQLIRVAILGGSTAFGTGVTDSESWPALLQQKLGNKYLVSNYGMPGYSTAEAIIQMGLLVPEFKPHIVIFYQGWNDIRNYHIQELGADYYAHGMMQFTNLRINNNAAETSFFQKAGDVSAIFKFLKILQQDVIEERTYQPKGPTFDEPDQFVDYIYERNLDVLYTLAHRINAKSIFIPQILNYEAYRGKDTARLWTPHIQDKAMPKLMERFNDIMNNICNERQPDCVVLESLRKVDWSTADFVDEGHLSKQGGMRFVEIVAERLKEYE